MDKIIIVLKNCHNQKLRRCRPFIHTFFRLFSALNGIFILVFDFLFVLLNLWPPLPPPINCPRPSHEIFGENQLFFGLAKKIRQIEVSYSCATLWTLQIDEIFLGCRKILSNSWNWARHDFFSFLFYKHALLQCIIGLRNSSDWNSSIWEHFLTLRIFVRLKIHWFIMKYFFSGINPLFCNVLSDVQETLS